MKRNTLSGISWSVFSSVITGIVQAAQLIIFARILQPSDFGLMGITIVILGFALAYADAGVSGAIIHHQEDSRTRLSSLLIYNFLTGITLFILLQLCIPLVVMFFRKPELLWLLRVAAVCVPVISLSKVHETVLQKELLFKTTAFIEITSTLVSSAAAIATVLAIRNVWAMVVSFVIFSSIRSMLYIVSGLPLFKPALHFRMSDLKEGYIGFGLYQIGERTINYLSERLDQLIIGRLGGTSLLGSYTVAFNAVIQPLNRINPILMKVMFPVFAKVQNDREQLKSGYMKTVSSLSFINTAVLFLLIAVASEAVPLIFGAKWSGSIPVFRILSVVVVIRCIGNPSGALSLAKGKADLGFYWNCLLLATTVPAIFIGFKYGKITGVAASLFAVQLILLVPFYYLYIRRFLGRCGLQYTVKAFSHPLWGAIGVLTACACGPLLVNFNSIAQLAVKGTVFIALYGILEIIFNLQTVKSVLFSGRNFRGNVQRI